MQGPLDCLVIGGGPAGLTAAVYLGRFLRSVIVIDKGGSRAEWIPRSHNLPGFPDGLAGPLLLERMRAQVRHYGGIIRVGEVAKLERSREGIFAASVDDAQIQAKTVILATGVMENKPPLPHVADAVKRGVIRTCPICDGYESRGRRVAVLGDGEHAAAEALFLRTYTDKLSLLMAVGPEMLSPTTRRALKRVDIAIRNVAIGAVDLQDDGLTALCVDDGEIHHFDVVYSAFGTTPQSSLVKDLGARMDAAGRLYVGRHQETSVKGLFAAGDLVRGLNQIAVANGEAAIAATAIHNRLPKQAWRSDVL